MGGGVAVDHQRDGLAWREAGPTGDHAAAGEALLFLHGLGGSRLAWEPQLDAFAAHHRCIAWDMPGYGAAAPIEPLTFPTIAQRVVDLLDALDIERTTLIGLSFGGMHALHTALEHPDRVARLVLADTSPAFGLDGTRRADWIASRLGPIDAGGQPSDAAEAIIDAITHVRLDGPIRAQTIEAFRRIPADGFRAAVNCLPDHDVRARLDEIDHPSLVIVGEHDTETPPSYSRMLADQLPNSELVVLDGVGHLSPTEGPGQFNAALRSFVGTPLSSSSSDHDGTNS